MKLKYNKELFSRIRRGFTLIELLVVVLIIAVLAAVALPQYNKAVIKARFAEIETNLHTLYQAQKRYYLEHDEYATDLSQLDVEIPECHCIPGVCETCWYRIYLHIVNDKVIGGSIGQDAPGPNGELSLFEIGFGSGTNCSIKQDGTLFTYSNVPEKVRESLGFEKVMGGCTYYLHR